MGKNSTTKTLWIEAQEIQRINLFIRDKIDYSSKSPDQKTIKNILLEIGTYEARAEHNKDKINTTGVIYNNPHNTPKMPIYFNEEEIDYILKNVPLPIDVRRILTQ